MTVQALKDELARLLGFSAENLLRLAIVVRELESRGEDLSGLKIGLLPVLRDIAAGLLLPEIVVRYAGEPWAIRKLTGTPLEEQRQIADGTRHFEPLPPSRPREKVFGEREPAKAYTHYEPQGRPMPSARNMGAVGTPKDIAELAVEMILQCPQKREVAVEVLKRLRQAGLLAGG